ncbi:MAG TPA: type II toxin-antitoxin system VapC family toxin [Phycisphaerales bacterium]|nr:type II toxin-antitoxin system VapC family toxin [Phycisphaerales bacterium]
MSRVVPDASVLAKLYFPEAHSDRAEALLRRRRTVLHAPDLVFAEVASIAWKRHRRGEIELDSARTVVAELLTLPIFVHPIAPLAIRSLELALETGRTVYDCLYLAVAIAERATLLTADERFVNALNGGPFARHVSWIGKH